MAIAELHKKRPRAAPRRRGKHAPKQPPAALKWVVATKRLERFEDNQVDDVRGQRRWCSVTYQHELVLCGKPKCRKWHGPYWYAYWTSGKRTRTLYIGKVLRPARVVLAEQRAKRAEKKA